LKGKEKHKKRGLAAARLNTSILPERRQSNTRAGVPRFATAPEPATLWLCALGVLFGGFYSRKTRA
jgi:hypothetical protein